MSDMVPTGLYGDEILKLDGGAIKGRLIVSGTIATGLESGFGSIISDSFAALPDPKIVAELATVSSWRIETVNSFFCLPELKLNATIGPASTTDTPKT